MGGGGGVIGGGWVGGSGGTDSGWLGVVGSGSELIGRGRLRVAACACGWYVGCLKCFVVRLSNRECGRICRSV